MDVVTRPFIASPTAHHHVLPEGMSIADMMAATGWDMQLSAWTVVTVEGQDVPAELWAQAKPRQGRRVLIGLRPGGGGMGGGTGKQVLQIVAAIAIIVVAAYVAGPLGAGAAVGTFLGVGTTVGTALVVAGISTAANLALAALIRPPSTSPRAMTANSSLGNAPEESRIYGVTGSQNTLRPYSVIPRVYGRHRFTAPLAAEPYVVSAGPTQTLYAIWSGGRYVPPVSTSPLAARNAVVGQPPML